MRFWDSEMGTGFWWLKDVAAITWDGGNHREANPRGNEELHLGCVSVQRLLDIRERG